jgi:cysteinyl-tRNA synthetase
MKKIYLCGPTLYSDIHIGNARSMVLFDVISEYYRRTEGVIYIRNITDVDDKIISLAGEQHPAEWVNENTLKSFVDAKKFLSLKDPDYEPRASNFIDDMILYIQNLEKKGYTFSLEDGIYLDITKVDYPTKISNRPVGSKQDSFAIWKFTDVGYTWDSPWGKGRPGWHTECAVMIDKLLGKVDLHGGGNDLLFPHHENENIQCRCTNGHDISVNWLHVGFVKVNNEKMSKSAGNVITVKQLEKDWSSEAIRVFLLMASYSKPIDFTMARMKEAETISIRRPEAAWLTTEEWSDKMLKKLENNFDTRL